MTTWQTFERLAAAARLEPVPTVDVRGAVLRSLKSQRKAPEAGVDPLVLALAGVSLAAAAVAFILALPASDTIGQAFVTYLDPLTMVLQ